MIAEWDEWATENQGTRECFEAALRAALPRMRSTTVAALVEALKEFVPGHQSGTLTEAERIEKAEAALRAAGVEM